MVLGERATILETINYPHKLISRRIKKHLGRLNKENLGTSLLIEEENKKLVNVED